MIKAKLKLYLFLIKSAEGLHITASRGFWELEKLRHVKYLPFWFVGFCLAI
jgi:hypothetical protein